jgi:type VI protein secretion system component VasK
MRSWFRFNWLAGLCLSIAASWAIWNYAPITDAQLRFAACIAPLVLLALIPALLGRRIGFTQTHPDSPGFREQRRLASTFLSNRGLQGRRGRQSVPLYLLIGAPGVGKSSLLEKSGMRLGMPTTIGQATWWVGEEAIFVETSIGAPDQKLGEVCGLIKQLRPAQPINGTVFVLSPADLTLADQTEHREFSQNALLGLREIETVTGQTAPVYMMLTKIDLLPGFQEFFDRQEPQERLQPWGFTLPLPAAGVPLSADAMKEAVSHGYQSLLAAMRARLVEWHSREADPVRCARINGFSAQVAALQNTVQPLLDAVFTSGGKAHNGAALRGIFLTSARQEALSIDSLLPELSRRFAMPRVGMIPPDLGFDDEDHGYFIAGTFKDTIFKEAGLVGFHRKGHIGDPVKWASAAALTVACLGVGYLVFQTFENETRWTTRGVETATQTKPITSPTTVAALSTITAALRRMDDLETAMKSEGPVLPLMVGLAARPKLDASVEEARMRVRRNALLPSLSALMETQLVDLNASVETMKGRIALASATGNPDDAALAAWLEAQAMLVPEADRGLFVSESKAAIAAHGGIAIDPAYLDAARRMIAYKESLS